MGKPEGQDGLTELRLTPASALTVAVRLHQVGRLQEAESVYRTLLGMYPNQSDVLNFLGVLSHQLGRSDEAIDLIRRSIVQAPDHADAHNNLGNVFKELGRPNEAAVCYRKVIALNPAHADAHNNLGTALRQQGLLAEAVTSYETAILHNPESADAYQNLGNVLKRLGRLEEAVSAYSRAIALKPKDLTAYMVYKNLGVALYRSGQRERAMQTIREWLGREPDNPFALHLLAAFSGSDIPARASDTYVQQLFDGCAESFEENLRDLEYRAPDLIASAVAEELAPSRGDLDVLDAGCGTGLCAPRLRSYARRLIGVDLSSMMLTKARARALYDELLVTELTGFMDEHVDAFDVIVSADTLVYFGSLEAVCMAAMHALRPGGRLFFTVEQASNTDAPNGFRLNPHGRYSHAKSHVERALTLAGFSISSLREATLRLEGGDPVNGLVVTARKPQS